MPRIAKSSDRQTLIIWSDPFIRLAIFSIHGGLETGRGLRYWGGGLDQASIEEVLSGNATIIGQDTKDRIAYLIQIRSALYSLFRNDSVDNQWLREPQVMLDSRAPLDPLLENSIVNL